MNFGLIRSMINDLGTLKASFTNMSNANPATDPDAIAKRTYMGALNMTLRGLINASIGETYAPQSPQQDAWLVYANLATTNLGLEFVSVFLDPYGTSNLANFLGNPRGITFIEPYFLDVAPTQRKEYLAMIIDEGLPAHQPVDKWLEKVVDDFDVEDEGPVGGFWGDATDDQHTGKIKVDDKVVTVEYDWAYPIYDQQDPRDTREDYKITYTYSDTGGQSSVEYTGSTTFYKTESLAPVIPGYEISILIGAAAISAIGLIYVIMKKKRM